MTFETSANFRTETSALGMSFLKISTATVATKLLSRGGFGDGAAIRRRAISMMFAAASVLLSFNAVFCCSEGEMADCNIPILRCVKIYKE
jgi:hypothetical protein